MCNNEKDSFPKEIFLAREERKGVFLKTPVDCNFMHDKVKVSELKLQ